MNSSRIAIEKFYMNVASDLEYSFEISSNQVVSIVWGYLSYKIICGQLKDKIKLYTIPNENISFETKDEFKDYLGEKDLNVILARLIFKAEDDFSFEFEVSGKQQLYGSPHHEFDTPKGEDWIKPRCIKLIYPALPFPDKFQPEDVYNEARLRGESTTRFLNPGHRADDGNVVGVFIWNEDYDSIIKILIEMYKIGQVETDIQDMVLRAKIGKKCDLGAPAAKINFQIAEKYWNFSFDEFGETRKQSYLLKFGKCPIEAVMLL